MAGFVLLAVAWGIATPVLEAPDEVTHYFVAQHIAWTQQLPVQTLDVDQRGPWEQEGSQPPLYYALVAPLARLANAKLPEDALRYNPQNSMGTPTVVGNENRFVHGPDEAWPWRGWVLAVHLARLASTAMGALAVAAACALLGRVMPSPSMAAAAAAVFAWNPQTVATFAALTNDAAIIALSAIALWLLARVLDGERRIVLPLALVLALAPLAKVSGLALVAFGVGTILWVAWRDGRWRWGAQSIVAIGAVVALVSGWWYLRNLQLYGSWTGFSHMLPEGVGREWNPERWLRGLPGELLGLWRSSWGVFGWFTVLLPRWVYGLIDAATLLAALGLARSAWAGDPDVRWRRLGWLGLWWLLVFAALLRWLVLVKGAHGRLLLPAFVALAAALVIGWRGLLPHRVSDRALAWGVAGAMATLAIGTLLAVVRPAFAGPQRVQTRPLDMAPLSIRFGQGVWLEGVRHPARAQEGELVEVALLWRVPGPIERPGLVELRLDPIVAGGDGPEVVAGGEARQALTRDVREAHLSFPAAGMAPFDLLARPGAGWVLDRHRVWAPALEGPPAPVEAWLEVRVYDRQAGRTWPATGPDEVGGGLRRRMVIEPRDPAVARGEVAGGQDVARFEGAGRLRLRRQGPELVSVAPGQEHSMPVRWAVLDAPPEELAMFVHLVAPSGDVVATFDGPPATHGAYPTSRWRAGETLPAEVGFQVPEDAAPGTRYELRVGLYRRVEDAPRVPAFRPAQGDRWSDDVVPLATVKVAEP